MTNLFRLIPLVVLGMSCSKSNLPAELPVLSVQSIGTPEGDAIRTLILTAILSAKATGEVRFTVTTMDGTAKAGEDYQALDGQSYSIPAGKFSSPIALTVVGDTLSEANEFLTLRISVLEGATVDPIDVTISLENDDAGSNPFFVPSSGYSTPLSYPDRKLIWQDEFDGIALNTSNWTHEIGVGNNGWGNNELQFYRSENTSVQGGYLVIEARKENFGGRLYTSSRLVTKDKFSFQYGRVDIRAALPFGKGIWPALWMLGASFPSVVWPACGEIDIMELVGGPSSDGTVLGTVHWSNQGQHAEYGGEVKLPSGKFHDAFHVFSVEWDSTRIQWLMDDVKFHEIDITPAELSEFRAPFFLIANVAVGGNLPGPPDATTIFPQRMIVDYIRVFQAK